ncbi:16S rRNA (guanine(527)-N(7))-methyltransferase RsmG [Arcticibacter tournemirensis]|uniref:Ribosomal RNA small subunit methyltransferase G n=1 Tax=Arcticibacter tournemirensis TaxID=699437 RepID=A0A4Q0MDS5_9SPHI|nr:16S rRNA (guanine(527)-N(7))-methyltransferase RsmG [Arcticibacter tournemirensis]RXF71089.1 16S rRNA (guanine(527)-N(7))-methyltransferase RsmG [Arcticibacter tournemirensis]
MTSDIIYHYFPGLSPAQKEQFDKLEELYTLWNAQINVISRKDIESLYLRHVLHSLGIAKVMPFLPGEKVLDVGTGGGFPGIPLAILFPETTFHLVDSIGKKIKVVNEISKVAGLTNIKASHARAEQIDGKFHFIVSRAVTRLGDFYPWIRGKFEPKSGNALPNGVLYLKGGDLEEEIKESRLKQVKLFSLSSYFSEDFFETKFVVYFPAQ